MNLPARYQGMETADFTGKPPPPVKREFTCPDCGVPFAWLPVGGEREPGTCSDCRRLDAKLTPVCKRLEAIEKQQRRCGLQEDRRINAARSLTRNLDDLERKTDLLLALSRTFIHDQTSTRRILERIERAVGRK